MPSELPQMKKPHGLVTHGMRQSREYGLWQNMKNRCGNPNVHNYMNYGGRGIKVCKRWLNSFANFYTDMGPIPSGMTIERKNINRGYSPQNCCWATASQQQRNKRNTRLLTYDGRTQALAAWVEETGLDHCKILMRLTRSKWTVGQALGFEPAPWRGGYHWKRKKTETATGCRQ